MALGRFVAALGRFGHRCGPFWTCQKFVGRFGFGPFWYRPVKMTVVWCWRVFAGSVLWQGDDLYGGGAAF